MTLRAERSGPPWTLTPWDSATATTGATPTVDEAGWKPTNARGPRVDLSAPPAMRLEGRQASVGIDCGRLYQPGDRLPQLRALPGPLAELQTQVNGDFEKHPQMYVDRYRSMVDAQGEVPTFSPDDAKGALAPQQWLGADGLTPEVKRFRSSGANAVLHQPAHATAQLAFMQRLDELARLPEGDPRRDVLVTNGGVGSGKSYALKKGLSEDFKTHFGAIWDSAGEQSGVDNNWIMRETAKRGIKTTLVYVKADPMVAFDRAVTKRFDEEGRLVSTRSFAESYVDGPQNMRATVQKLAHTPGDVELVVVDNTGPTVQATVLSKQQAQALSPQALDALIPPPSSTIAAIKRQLDAAVPATLPDYARAGLKIPA